MFGFGPPSRCISPCPVQTSLWKDRAGSANTWCSVTMQTVTKIVSNRKIEDTWLKQQYSWLQALTEKMISASKAQISFPDHRHTELQ